MTLTLYGIKEWGLALIVAIILVALTWFFIGQTRTCLAWGLTVLWVILFLAIAAFFRNPTRKISENPNHLVSPADGVIKDIEVVSDFNQAPFKGEALRIGIFLSVFNVHVNRACADIEIVSKHYREGEYLDARHAECAKRNEAMTIGGHAKLNGIKFPLAIRQISGAIARRIVCPVIETQKLKRGEIYGMIKFGSRTEIYIPKDKFDLKVKIGDKVYAGSTVIAEIQEEK